MSTTTKSCIACGMPMVQSEDFALGDRTKDYCRYCARPDGTMQSYDEKLESMSGFIVRTQGLDRAVARETARAMMAKLPAWKGRGQSPTGP
jgi:hypothetical protein